MTLLSTSCDGLFTNYFKEMGLGQVKAEDITTTDSSAIEAEAYSSDGSLSTSYVEVLTANTETKTAVLTTLETTYTAAVTTDNVAAVQEAAALAALIEISTTDAIDIVNNVASSLSSITSLSSSATTSDVMSIVESIVPASIASDETAFTAAVTSLLAANEAYTVLGTSINTAAISADSSINTGTAVQAAIVAAAVAAVDNAVTAAVATDGDVAGYTTTASLLYALVSGSTTVDALSALSITVPDYGTDTPLGNLLAAAGITL